MILSIDERSPVPIFRQISLQVKMMVASGELKPEAALPSIRDVAVRTSVNPNTVGKAYRELENEGIITMKRGIGAYVAATLPDNFLSGFSSGVIDTKVHDLVSTATALSVGKELVVKKVKQAFEGGVR